MRKLPFLLARTSWLVALLASPSYAAKSCDAIATRDLSARENLQATLKKGERDRGVTQYSVDKNTGETWFCSHGGSCFPAAGLKLIGCKIGKSKSFTDSEEIGYSVDVR